MVIITVGGLPGSGTTTACRTLKERLGLDYVYAGQIFRDLAHERGMTLAEFGRYCEDHPEVDRELDQRQVALMRSGNMIIEGRLSGWLAMENEISALTIWLWAPVNVRAERLVKREGGDLAQRKEEMLEREFSEAKRYKSFYGMDIDDQTIYDLVIHTEDKPPENVVELILAAVAEKEAEL